MRCPVHKTPLVFDERTIDHVPDGLGRLGAERRLVTVRYVCPVDDCAEQIEDAA